MTNTCRCCGAPLVDLDATWSVEDRIITARGQQCRLTRIPAEIFNILWINRARKSVFRDALFNAVWGLDPNGGPGVNVLQVHICRIRRSLAPLGLTITSGIEGYRLVEIDAPPIADRFLGPTEVRQMLQEHAE